MPLVKREEGDDEPQATRKLKNEFNEVSLDSNGLPNSSRAPKTKAQGLLHLPCEKGMQVLHLLPCQKEMRKSQARIWPKTAVSAHFHTMSFIAGPGAAKVPESGSKRLPARIWPKTAVPADSSAAFNIELGSFYHAGP